MENKIDHLKTKINTLKKLRKNEDESEIKDELRKLIRFSGLEIPALITRRSRFDKTNNFTLEEVQIEEIQEQIQELLETSKLNLAQYCEERKNIEQSLQKVDEYLKSQNLIYICNYSANENEEEETLLCRISNIDMNEAQIFLKELSQKIFLAAPVTQVFHFLSKNSKKLLFRDHSEDDYYSNLKTAKSKIPGFFTYDFLAVDILIKAFIKARDQDFVEAIEKDKYGENYNVLKNDLNKILVTKKINIDRDLAGVNFKLNTNEDDLELYPEDLSHGELKRLSIYMWIKHCNIENAIVLMDEIEIAFHPDWQYQIISDLREWSPSNQYILATHSYDLCQALTPAHVKELEPKLLKQEAQSEK